MFRRVFDRALVLGEPRIALLGHDAQPARELCGFASLVLQLDSFFLCVAVGLLFGFEESAGALAVLSPVDDEFEVGALAVAIASDAKFVSPHGITVATLLPQKQVKSRYYAFFCGTMRGCLKVLFSEGKWPF